MSFPKELGLAETASFVSNVRANGDNFDCSGYDLFFKLRGPTDTAEKSRQCTWITQNVGRFRLKFDASDLDESGDWIGEFQLTDGTDTVHGRKRINFRVRPSL